MATETKTQPYVVHGPGNVRVIHAESPSAALRICTSAAIKTRPGMLVAGSFATIIPAGWS